MYSDDISPFRPRGEPNGPVRVMAVGFAAICVLYAGVDWKRSADERLQRSVEPAAARPATARPVPAHPVPPRPAPARPEPRTEALAKPAARRQAEPVLPARTTIYRCKDDGGATFWSSASCQTRRATVDRMTDVPGHLPFEQQVAIASGAADDAAWLYRPPSAPAGAGNIGSGPVSPRRGECAALDDSIRQIDATTRRPLRATLQDDWRAQRTALQNQRFAARC